MGEYSDELTEYYVQLRTLIEMLYRYNDNKKVVILAHSMGNPVMQVGTNNSGIRIFRVS